MGQADPVLAPVPRTTSYQSPFDGSTQEAYRFRFLAEREIGEGLTLRNRLYYTQLTWDSDGTLVLGAFPGYDGRLQVQRTLALLDDRQKLLGNQLELNAAFDTGSVRHDLLVGVELQSLKDRFTQEVGLLPPIDLLDPVETAQPPIITIPPFAQAGDSSSFVVAPYLVDRLRFSPKVQAFVGARLDALRLRGPPERDGARQTRGSTPCWAWSSPRSRTCPCTRAGARPRRRRRRRSWAPGIRRRAGRPSSARS